jgi:hypothetical protein
MVLIWGFLVGGRVAGKEAAGKRAPRNEADALGAAQRDHLPLLLAIDEVVVILHAHDPGEAKPLGGGEHPGELPGVHRRCADVERLAGLDDVAERLQRLLDRRRRVEAVDLVEVDVVGAQSAQAVVDGMQDVLARQAALVGVVAHRVEDLGAMTMRSRGAPSSLSARPSTSSLAPSE